MIQSALKSPLPRFSERNHKPKRDKEYVPGDLRPDERLAHLAALSIAAEYDAQGLDVSVVTYRAQGTCLVMLDGVVVATTFAVSDEGPTIESLTSDVRERLRLATKQIEGDGA